MKGSKPVPVVHEESGGRCKELARVLQGGTRAGEGRCAEVLGA